MACKLQTKVRQYLLLTAHLTTNLGVGPDTGLLEARAKHLSEIGSRAAHILTTILSYRLWDGILPRSLTRLLDYSNQGHHQPKITTPLFQQLPATKSPPLRIPMPNWNRNEPTLPELGPPQRTR